MASSRLEIELVAYGVDARLGAGLVRVAAGGSGDADGAQQRAAASTVNPPPTMTAPGRWRIPACIMPGWLMALSSVVLVRKLAAVHALPEAVDTV